MGRRGQRRAWRLYLKSAPAKGLADRALICSLGGEGGGVYGPACCSGFAIGDGGGGGGGGGGGSLGCFRSTTLSCSSSTGIGGRGGSWRMESRQSSSNLLIFNRTLNASTSASSFAPGDGRGFGRRFGGGELPPRTAPMILSWLAEMCAVVAIVRRNL